MANKRMFSKSIIDSDAFLEMPQSSQNLYFHLSMRADDDGFINNPKSIMRIVGCKDDDVNILLAKKFLIVIYYKIKKRDFSFFGAVFYNLFWLAIKNIIKNKLV